MILADIGKSPNTTFKRINQHLETNYGFKISENSSDTDLTAIMEQLEEEITDLKIKGDDSKTSSEISKRLLILEGIRQLREYAPVHLTSPAESPDKAEVLQKLVDIAVEEFRLCGDFDEAVRHAMKHYRSSRYRFLPDENVEDIIRGSASMNSKPSLEIMLEETDEEVSQEDAEGTGTELSEEDDEQISMIRDKSGRMVQDTTGSKGLTMKEHANLVKNLRRLLETEVSQADVMMKAKKFSEELQEMVEKIGRLQNEELPPVVDQMRETYGTESATTFQTQIYGSFQGVMDTLYTAKEQVDNAVGSLATTGQIGMQTDMDKGIGGGEMGGDPNAELGAELATDGEDLDNIGAELEQEPEDEFGGEEALGRSKKMESVLQRKVMEMRRLVARAKQLKEASRN